MLLTASLLFLVLSADPTKAAKIPLESLEATFIERPDELPGVVDGWDTGKKGWSIFPQTGAPQALVLKTAHPVQAQSFEFTLCFLSGLPLRYFGNFALSYTSDPSPSLSGNWQRFMPERFTATGTALTLEDDGRLTSAKADSMVGDAIFQVRVPAPASAITGFRIDVFPFEIEGRDGVQLAWNKSRDFCLTEFRVDAIKSNTTNIAAGAPVTASHPLWAGAPAGVLTDGLPGSFNHPADANVGADFYFEIDLGSVRNIDHIGLRSRADGYARDRMTRVVVELFDKAPGNNAPPAWNAMDRADGSSPSPGEIDIVRAADGSGTARGRYLRISSDSQIALSPQLAEVEVYPVLTPEVGTIKVDGEERSSGEPLRLPAGTAVCSIGLKVPGTGLPEPLPIRWRLRGLHEDWQITDRLLAEISKPPHGTYQFEAQVRHSDGQWDATALSIPVSIAAHFWETAAFPWALAGLGTVVVAFGVQTVARRREARRMAIVRHQSALAEERSRIARDMHDEVGARLSQLALMQDLVVRQHALPEDARQSLRQLASKTRHAVDALEQVVWAVNPQHDTLAGVTEYLSYTASSYLTPLDVHCRLDLPLTWPEVKVRAQVRHQLILAFREALQNIAKHANASAVTLTIRYTAPELVIRLTDNGMGMPEESKGVGKDGLLNMRSRLDAIGGSSDVACRPEGGTEVKFCVPLGHWEAAQPDEGLQASRSKR